MRKFIITEEEKNKIRGLYEQQTTVPFYDFLIQKGYDKIDDWTTTDDQNMYKEIKNILNKFNYNVVLFVNNNKGVVPIKLITNGDKIYFLGDFYPNILKDKFPNPKGPFSVTEIKKYL